MYCRGMVLGVMCWRAIARIIILGDIQSNFTTIIDIDNETVGKINLPNYAIQ